MNEFVTFAQAAPPGQSQMWTMGLMVIVIGFMFYSQFRQQRRRDKERKEMLAAIKTGDRVLFSGGIVGVITNVKEKTYVIRVGEKTKIEVLRGAVTSVVKSDELPAGTEADLGGN